MLARNDTPRTVTPEMIAEFRAKQPRFHHGRFYFAYVGGPADGLRLAYQSRDPGTGTCWHFGARNGSYLAWYKWDQSQGAFVFAGWEPLNHSRLPGFMTGQAR